MLSTLDSLDVSPDADPEFLSNLRAMLVTKIRETNAADLQSQADSIGGGSPMSNPTGPSAMGADLAGGLAPPPMSDPAAMAGAGGGMGGMGGGVMGAGAPGPGRGVSPRPAPPDADSLRRILNIS